MLNILKVWSKATYWSCFHYDGHVRQPKQKVIS